MKLIEELLEEHSFIRVRRSFLVNLDEVEKYVKADGGYLVMSNGAQIHISRNKKEELLKKLVSGKECITLISIAFVIAVPVGYYFVNKWLQDFAYRINIGWWMFAAAGIFVLAIALLTMSFQTIKAARANPVKSLKTE